MRSPFRQFIKSFLYYLSLAIAVSYAFHFVSGFFSLDLHVPIADGGSDFLPIFYQIKSLINNDWFPFTGIRSERLGYPFGADWNDYPMNHSLFYIIIRFIGIFSKDWAFVFNIYWLCTFILSALTFTYTLRKLSINMEVAFVFGILFSFMPFHFFRMGHIWLSSYFMVPLQILVLLRIFDNDPVFFSDRKREGSFWIRNEKKISTFIILILSGWAGIYYVFFFCAIAFFVMIGISLQRKSWRHLLSGLAIIGLCFISVLSDSIPTIIKNIKYGMNAGGFHRSFVESEVYGLRLTQLLLPSPHHRIPQLAALAEKYNSKAPLITENHTATLGILGVLGISILILILFNSRVQPLLRKVSKLNIAALLIGTIGGYGSVFAFLISPSIRGYNRISVFIYAFASICLAYLISQYSKKISKPIYWALILVICIFGIWEQSSDYFRYSPSVGKYREYKNFFSRIELLAGNSAIYQLPAVDVPDIVQYNKMGEYEQLRGYLFTDTVRWSYGNIFGRYKNAWLQNRSYQTSTANFIRELISVDFKYIYLNKTGYADNGKLMLNELSKNLGKPVLTSPDDTLVLFDLSKYNKPEYEEILSSDNLFKLPAFSYGERVIFTGSPRIGNVAMIPFSERINLFNPEKENQLVQIKFVVEEVVNDMIFIEHLGTRTDVKLGKLPSSFNGKFELPPGKSDLLFDNPSHTYITISSFSIKKIN